jgi:thiol-disulfide isomerase/thioredoxin
MKLPITILLGVVFLLSTAFTPNSNKLPDVMLKTLDGKSVNIQEFSNNEKITILSFWATWCSPCKRELDAISEIYDEWVENYNVELIAITIDNARALAKVKPMVAQKAWDFLILSDVKQELQQALNFQAIPQTFLVDQNGNIVWTHTGYQPGDEYELEDKIKSLAGK